MKYKLFITPVILLSALSCSEIGKTKSHVTTPTESINSVTSTKHSQHTVGTEDSTSENSANVRTQTYVSNDGKTNFVFIPNETGDAATVKNESTGKEYKMKTVQSASGAKYEDSEGNFFWMHQGGFIFGKGEKTEIEGTEKN